MERNGVSIIIRKFFLIKKANYFIEFPIFCSSIYKFGLEKHSILILNSRLFFFQEKF